MVVGNSIGTIIETLKENKSYLHDKYNVIEIGIFGSYARNEQSKDSDLDVLIGFSSPIGWAIVDLKDDLEELLHIKIDLVSKNAVKRKKRLWDSICEDIVYA